MARSKLFEKADPAIQKDASVLVRMSQVDRDEIRHLANIRQMSVSDFMRRAALGRKADVDYETETILILSEVTKLMRLLHAELVDQGVAPLEDDMRLTSHKAGASRSPCQPTNCLAGSRLGKRSNRGCPLTGSQSSSGMHVGSCARLVCQFASHKGQR